MDEAKDFYFMFKKRKVICMLNNSQMPFHNISSDFKYIKKNESTNIIVFNLN